MQQFKHEFQVLMGYIEVTQANQHVMIFLVLDFHDSSRFLIVPNSLNLKELQLLLIDYTIHQIFLRKEKMRL